MNISNMNGYHNEKNLPQEKVFNDSVHGSITLPPFCIAIIDSPQFQRLRYLKQVGSCSFVYPAASHTRFEHSLGVSYLAGKMCEHLKNKQPELNITDMDVLCVQVAGLCHDLGHGPFSHLWENFLRKSRPAIKWKHEQASILMLDHLLHENKINIADYGLCDEDLNFIKEMMIGIPSNSFNSKDWSYKGRPKEKRFLYEIVANQRNGVDVDKWDYFLRDSHNLGLSISFSYNRLMQFCKVFDDKDEGFQICFRDKEVENIQEMFHTRYILHRKAYQHKTNHIIDLMLIDIFSLVDPYIEFRGKDDKVYKLSDTVDDMVAFTNVTDFIFQQASLLYSKDEKVKKAQSLLNNIACRKLYPYIGNTLPNTNDDITEENILEQIKEQFKQLSDDNDLIETAIRSVIVKPMRLNYGMGKENPLKYVRLYTKREPKEVMCIRKSEVTSMLPFKFEDVVYRVISRCYDKPVNNLIKRAFYETAKTLKLELQEESCNSCLTPLKASSADNYDSDPIKMDF